MIKTLNLTLRRKWFDQIVSGEKRIEFREMKSYWNTRIEGRSYDEIRFTNGYRASAPFTRVEYLGYYTSGNHYCLKLGKVLEVFIP